MEQTKIESLIETVMNTLLGFVISLCVWLWVVAPLYGIPVQFGTSIGITAIFTVSSLLRGYLVRRFFNGGMHKVAHDIAIGLVGVPIPLSKWEIMNTRLTNEETLLGITVKTVEGEPPSSDDLIDSTIGYAPSLWRYQGIYPAMVDNQLTYVYTKRTNR